MSRLSQIMENSKARVKQRNIYALFLTNCLKIHKSRSSGMHYSKDILQNRDEFTINKTQLNKMQHLISTSTLEKSYFQYFSDGTLAFHLSEEVICHNGRRVTSSPSWPFQQIQSFLFGKELPMFLGVKLK